MGKNIVNLNLMCTEYLEVDIAYQKSNQYDGLQILNTSRNKMFIVDIL